jgi:BASS family bile acid:Na+ symporter
MTNFTVLAIAIFVAIGLLTGHLLGGPDDEDRTALALATATRHPGVAIAVLHAIGPVDPGVVPVVVLYLLVGMVAAAPYVAWRKRAHAAAKSG